VSEETFENLIPLISFFKQPTHIVEFDPAVAIVTVSGQRENGESWTRKAIPVKEENVQVLLPLSKGLTMKLKRIGIGKKATLKITRTGSGFDTDYSVEVMSFQQKVSK
jgi:hypothetical protein